MVIDDFDIKCMSFRPAKTDPPLIVDTDAVLALAIALQCFQPVSGRYEQVLEGARLAQIKELAARRPLDRSETRDLPVIKQRFRIGRTEGLDHVARVLRVT